MQKGVAGGREGLGGWEEKNEKNRIGGDTKEDTECIHTTSHLISSHLEHAASVNK